MMLEHPFVGLFKRRREVVMGGRGGESRFAFGRKRRVMRLAFSLGLIAMAAAADDPLRDGAIGQRN